MIIGPSGVGKDTFMQKMINKYPKLFVKCISCTTRKPRDNEQDGVNYYFISKEKFHQLEQQGDIIGKFEKYNTLYGTSKKNLNNILSNDKIVYFDYNIATAIDIYNKKNIGFNYIALIPPSVEILGQRLRHRGTESEESINKRLCYAPTEIDLIKKSTFLNYVIKNEDMDKTFDEFEMGIKKLYSHLFR